MSKVNTDPNLTATVYELPAAAEAARTILQREGMADRVQVQVGNFQQNELGEGYDLILLFGVLVSETPASNETYFKAGLPYLDEVIFRVIPEQNSQVLALEQGEVDFIWGVPGGDIERLSTDENIRLYNVNSGPGGGFCIMTVTFNLEREIFQDLRIRQAIAHAIDREQILK